MKRPNPKKASSIDILEVLRALDQNDLSVYANTQGEERKDLDKAIPFVLPCWMTVSPEDNAHVALLLRFNRMVNPGWWDLRGHPELQMKLLACVGLGREVPHGFSNPARGMTATGLFAFLRGLYPDMRREEFVLWCKKNDEASLRGLLNSEGVQEKEAETLTKEYRKVLLAIA